MKKWMVVAVALLAGCTSSETTPSRKAAGSPACSGANTDSLNVHAPLRIWPQLITRARQYKIALDELRKAIMADSGYGPAYNVYGLVYMDLAEDKLAEENFRRAIELNPNNSDARTNFGWFLCTRGRTTQVLLNSPRR